MASLFVFLAALIGLLIGSFLNCLIWRIYKEESIMGRSYCPKCLHKISWYDNIPLLSFLMLKRRCRHCSAKISWQYPLVELVTSLLFVASFLSQTNIAAMPLLLVRDWLLIVTFIIVFVYDLRWQLVPMIVVWPMIIVMVIFNIFIGYTWQSILLAGLAGALFFLIQYLITARRGLGEGDIWLGLLIGISLSEISLLIVSLALSYFIGALISMALLTGKRKGWKSKIALGPFLSFGIIMTLIYGQKIVFWYFNLL